MLALFIIAGFIAGAAVGSFEGAIIGACFAGMICYLRELHLRLSRLEIELDDLIRKETSQLSEHSSKHYEPLEQTGKISAPADVGIHVDSHEIMENPEQGTQGYSTAEETDQNTPTPTNYESWHTATNQTHPSRATALVIDQIHALLSQWLRFIPQNNPILQVGVILVFMGMAFLLKYAAGYFTLSIASRVMIVILTSLAMLAFGWRIRNKNRSYSLIIQGAGSGLFYLTIFTALARYHLISTHLAFALLVIAVIVTIGLALYQNAKSLALFSIIGGFAAPFLVSTGSGNHIILFSYYLLLNAIILSVAWFRAWRSVNIIGFFFTFVVLSGWVLLKFSAMHTLSTLLFLIIFFVLYFAVSILFSLRKTAASKPFVDGTLIFGNPTLLMGNLAIILERFEYGLAWSFFLLGTWYAASHLFIRAKSFQHLQLLKEAFYVIALVCFTLSIPFIFQSKLVSASAWGLEGAAILWVSIQQKQRFQMWFALLLQACASLLTLRVTVWPTINDPSFIHYTLVAVGGLFCAWLTRTESSDTTPSFLKKASPLLLLHGIGWLTVGGLIEIYQACEVKDNWYAYAVLFWSLSLIGLVYVGNKIRWTACAGWMKALPWGLGALLVISVIDFSHPFEHWGWFAWPVVLAIYLGTLHVFGRHDSDVIDLGYHHVAWIWITTALSTIELQWQMAQWFEHHENLADTALVWPALLVIAFVTKLKSWPFAHYRERYLLQVAMPFVSVLLLWWWKIGIGTTGDVFDYLHVPILNPLDITSLAVIAVIAMWLQQTKFHIPKKSLITGMLFITGNAILFRAMHHWIDVPYSATGLWNSTIVQTVVSITWSVLGVFGMWLASNKANREWWVSSAALLGIITIKLLLVDLSNSGTLERIISFLGVGFLMLGIGYVSPLPSSVKTAINQDSEQAS